MIVNDRPRIDAAEAERLALERYGLRVRARELPSERDRTFRLEGAGGRAVLKVAHHDEARDALELQHAALARLRRGPDARLFPEPIASSDGAPLIEIVAADDRRHLAQLLTWLPGRPYAEVGPAGGATLEAIGHALGTMDHLLAGLSHPAMDRPLQWDSRRAPTVVRRRLADIVDPVRRTLAESALAAAEARLARYTAPQEGAAGGSRHGSPAAPQRRDIDSGLRLSVIHNDVNDHNLLLDQRGAIAGIIDFGDLLRSYTAAELANAAAYLMMGTPEPLATLARLQRGYERAYPLTDAERDSLLDLVRLRLCLSVSISAHQSKLAPDDPYLTVSEAPAWALLARLAQNR